MWGATPLGTLRFPVSTISIHAPRVGGDVRAHHLRMVDIISIHAPRVGGDFALSAMFWFVKFISIHAPRVGGDATSRRSDWNGLNFNPRPPCGGRLGVFSILADNSKNFNPRPPCGGRLGTSDCWYIIHTISIHAPRVGGDYGDREFAHDQIISIHAPRVGGDAMPTISSTPNLDFNPRPPCGGRRCRRCRRPSARSHFNPRPPCGGRRPMDAQGGAVPGISIHAPRVGGDSGSKRTFAGFVISIHAPRVGGDSADGKVAVSVIDFNPRPPCGGRRSAPGARCHRTGNFNPRPPCGGRPVGRETRG